MPARLFFSYAHVDEALRNRLEVSLAMLRREGLIEAWHDRRLVPGEAWDGTIKRELDEADVVLFLVSPDFLASDYCWDVEVTRAMTRHEAGEAVVIPVILRPSDWHGAPFAKLQGLPKDALAITKWPDVDDAFLDVTRGIRRAIAEMPKATSASKPTPPPPPASSPIAATTIECPRSSNLRVRREFTERDKDRFLDEAYDHVAKFFEGSLEELAARNADVETNFKRLDATRFTATIYRGGRKVAACTIFRGGGAMGRWASIVYAANDGGATNQWNESASVENDDQSLFLKTMGMVIHCPHDKDAHLSPTGLAETFWSMLMEPLQ